MSDNYHNYQLLLAKAAQLYERHRVGRPDPFNVFSSLQNKNGHLNETLHSRFLYALLDYKKPRDEIRENLKDFLLHVGVKDFELCGVKVKRECDGIDILIINADKKAVVIENKSNPNRGDEDEQLWRYYSKLEDQGYSDIHLLYLTPDGHDPSPDSVGDLKKEETIKIAYKDDLIQTWLERCQKRAYDEPELRDSIAQYLRLVRKLTGTDSRGKYMEDLKELCLEYSNGVPNFVLVQALNKAMFEAWTELSKRLWNEIKYYLESDLKSEIPDLLTKDEEHENLCYQLSEATSLQVGAVTGPQSVRIWFGVNCSKEEYKDKYDKLNKALKGISSDEEPNNSHPWWRFADEDLFLEKKEHFERLSNDTDRQDYARKTAQGIAQGLKEVWEVLEDLALVNAIKEGEKTELVSKEQIFETLESVS